VFVIFGSFLLAIIVLQQAADPSNIVLDVSEQSHGSGDVAVVDRRLQRRQESLVVRLRTALFKACSLRPWPRPGAAPDTVGP
jgi:hypothetical protein